MLTCSLGFVLATLVTAANVHDTAAAGLLLDRAAAMRKLLCAIYSVAKNRKPFEADRACGPENPSLDVTASHGTAQRRVSP